MVVFFDIDGTVVDEETQLIPESTVRAVEKLRENGHIAVVNTGRPLSHIDPRVRQLDFSGSRPEHFLTCCHCNDLIFCHVTSPPFHLMHLKL